MSNWPDFEIPESWRVIEARETAAVIKAGGTPSRKQASYWNGDIPFVLIEDMTAAGLYLDHTSERITKAGLDASSAWIVPSGAVLLSMYATIGATVVNKIPLATNQAILAIVPKKNVSAEFLAFCLRAHKAALSARNVQATQKNINKGIVETFPLPIPPLSEQRKIAGVLGVVQRAIEQQEQLIALTIELKKAFMNKLFTNGLRGEPQKQSEVGPVPESWVVAPLTELVKDAPQVDIHSESKKEIQYIDVSSISRTLLRIDSTTRYVLKDAPGRARKKVKTGDVIFATVRPTLLRTARISPEYDEQVCSTAFCVLRDRNRKTNGRFISYLVQREQFVKHLAAIESGVSYPSVTDRQVKEQLVPVPHEDEQIEIATILESCDSKIIVHTGKARTLADLFRTLLHQLMTAQLRVNDLDLSSLESQVL
jgi:type I restriction enzyme S subunit